MPNVAVTSLLIARFRSQRLDHVILYYRRRSAWFRSVNSKHAAEANQGYASAGEQVRELGKDNRPRKNADDQTQERKWPEHGRIGVLECQNPRIHAQRTEEEK